MQPDRSITVKPTHHAHRQRGVGLVEVLVTVVILAIGLLGITALQLMSKRSNLGAEERTTASMLAEGILERMRANSTALVTYAGTQEAPAAELDGTMGTPAINCAAAACPTPADVAVYDLWQLDQAVAGASAQTAAGDNTSGLLQPTVCISTNVPAANVNTKGQPDRSGHYQVAVVWRGSTKLTDPAPAIACGQASGKYDDTGGDNAYRRVLLVDTYISQ